MKHMRTQHSGEAKALTCSKEMKVYQALQNAGVSFQYQLHIPFAGCGIDTETKHARVDFVIAKEWGHIILEVDEDQHRSYPIWVRCPAQFLHP